MDKGKLQDQIADFWEWFTLNQEVLEAVIAGNHHPQTEYVIQNLDEFILAMGKIKWELANPKPDQYVLTLSPNADRELLKITKEVMQLAPQVGGWTFYHATQPNGQYQLSIYDAEMDIQQVNAENWQCVVLKTPDNRFELFIQPSDTDYLDEDTEFIAVDLTLTNLLGEEEKINHLAGFELVNEFPPKLKNKSFPIQKLKSQLELG